VKPVKVVNEGLKLMLKNNQDPKTHKRGPVEASRTVRGLRSAHESDSAQGVN